eukprot:TRINITY_DN6595_c0_g1_i1.p1 TRINITY_DN6595_c0_g1~~TRINITY_DN6595_c0_g1_i1.p1  ORF type:complete len:672 (-),score=129.74 TRINITY_DN6595_c0_g1_i1:2-1984(-)
MGNLNEREELRKYWKKSEKGLLRISQDDRYIRRCFEKYDIGNKGYLSREEGMRYIIDFLSIGGLEEEVRLEAERNGFEAGAYFDQYVQNIFAEMDTNNDQKIQLNEILKPKSSVWRNFMHLISVQTLHELQKREREGKQKRKRGTNRSSRTDSPSSRRTNRRRKDKSSTDDEPADDPITVVKKRKKHAEDELFEEDIFGKNNEEEPKKRQNNALTQSDVVNMRIDYVMIVSECLGIPNHVSQGLLSFYKWDKQELLDAYFENPDQVLSLAGIDPSALENETSSEEHHVPEQIECTVCFEETDQFTALDKCHHYFCNDCWGDNLNIQIREGRTVDITCMHQGCTELVPDYIVRDLVDADLWKRYSTFLSKNFVEGSNDVRWCPAAGCERALYDPIVEGENFVGVCECGQKFCWKCGKEYHTPATCEQFELWQEKSNNDEILTKMWLQMNTKRCPSCRNAIEKNDGCFMMTCGKCRHQFCWLCCEPWFTHSDHFTCSKFRSKKLQNAPEFKGGQKNDYIKSKDQKYIYYFERHRAYVDAIAKHETNKNRLEGIITTVKGRDDLKQIDYLLDACDKLTQCRVLTKNMCIAIATEQKRINLNQLSNYQETLEILTERLASKIEREANEWIIENNENWGVELRSLLRLTENCVENILESGFDRHM